MTKLAFYGEPQKGSAGMLIVEMLSTGDEVLDQPARAGSRRIGGRSAHVRRKPLAERAFQA